MDPEFYRCEMLKVRVFFTHEETTEAKEGMSYLRLSVIRLELTTVQNLRKLIILLVSVNFFFFGSFPLYALRMLRLCLYNILFKVGAPGIPIVPWSYVVKDECLLLLPVSRAG